MTKKAKAAKPRQTTKTQAEVFGAALEHEQTPFDVLSDRIVAAIAELNSAFAAASDMPEMHVYLHHIVDTEQSLRIQYDIFRRVRTAPIDAGAYRTA